MCEATFTALSANARAAGFATAGLDQGARAAHIAWRHSHPGSDGALYQTALKVRAMSLRQAMHDGRITLAQTLGRLVTCHTRYQHPQRVAEIG